MVLNKFKEAINVLNELQADRSIPKNIKNTLHEAKTELESKQENAIKADSAIQIIDSITNDTNLSTYVRTEIWKVVSLIESAKD